MSIMELYKFSFMIFFLLNYENQVNKLCWYILYVREKGGGGGIFFFYIDLFFWNNIFTQI